MTRLGTLFFFFRRKNGKPYVSPVETKKSKSGFTELLKLLSRLEFLEENWPGFHISLSSKEIVS